MNITKAKRDTDNNQRKYEVTVRETNRLRKCVIKDLMKMSFRIGIYWQVFNRISTNFTEFTKFKAVKQWVDFSGLEK